MNTLELTRTKDTNNKYEKVTFEYEMISKKEQDINRLIKNL